MNNVHIYQKDALDFLKGIQDETVDVIVTDPPYWTLDRWRNIGTTTRLGGNRNKEAQRDEMFFETIETDAELLSKLRQLSAKLKNETLEHGTLN